MIVIAFLIGLSLLLALGFLAAFFWGLRDGQNDDLETPAIRILFDQKPNHQSEEK